MPEVDNNQEYANEQNRFCAMFDNCEHNSNVLMLQENSGEKSVFTEKRNEYITK